MDLSPKAKVTAGGLIAAILGAFVQNTVWTGDMVTSSQQMAQEIKLLRADLMHEIRLASTTISVVGAQVSDHEQRLRELERLSRENHK